jgi:uncharacterized repeat protein (TIGR03803 family)
MDSSGNLYGTILWSGVPGLTNGLYKITQASEGFDYSLLHSFCSKPQCADGSDALGPVVVDSAGNIFGATDDGGPQGTGVLYELSGSSFRLLHTFCRTDKCYDGDNPNFGLIADSAGNLYGTTGWRGKNDAGTVFRLTP